MASTRGGTAADYVADANGRPVVGAEVEVRATAADAGTLIHTTTSGANGLIPSFTVPSAYDETDVFWRARKGAGAWSAWVRLQGDVGALRADVAATYQAKATTHTAAGAAPGFQAHLQLDYDVTSSTLPEPLLVETKRDGAFKRAWWLNEAGNPRAQSVKNEAALKLYGPQTGYGGEILEVLDKHTGTQTHLWGVNGEGNPVIGSGRTEGANVIILGPADPVPSGIPAGTVIVRTA